MKRRSFVVRVVRAAGLGAVALACSRSPGPSTTSSSASVARAPAPPAPSVAPAPPALAKDEVVALMEALARVHAEHAKDCARLTTELETFEKTRQSELSRAAPAAYAAIEADPPLAERLGHAMETIMTASMACANEPRFAALHARRRGRPVPAAPSGSVAPLAAPSPAPAGSTRL